MPLKDVNYSNGTTLHLDWGFGSAAAHRATDGEEIFYTLTDRGPNIKCKDAQEIIGLDEDALCQGDKDGKIFPVPEFTPTIVRWKLEGETATVLDRIPLRNGLAEKITGLSNPLRNFPEKAYDNSGKRIEYNPEGLDSEALYVMKDGSFWIGEEYAPSLVHVAKDGTILQRWVPQGLESDLNGSSYPVKGVLPAILAKRHPNRGIEAIALSPDEKTLYFAMQSPLDNPDYADSDIVRIYKVEIAHPDHIALYAYKEDPADSFEYDDTAKQKKVKISEMSCLGDDKLLIDERVSKTTKLYAVDLAKVSEVPAERYEDLETDQDGVSFLSKTQIKVESAPSKIEGIAHLGDKKFLLINDNDFGIEGDLTTAKVEELNVTE